MKQLIQKILRKQFGLQLNRVAKNPVEAPVPFINKHALRLLHFYELTRKVDHVWGNIVECGVGPGKSLYAFCLFQETLDICKGRRIFGFDSFKGFPEPSVEDEPEVYGIKKGQHATSKKSVIKHLLNSGITQGFIDSRLTLVKGFFENTLWKYDCQYRNGPIALLHLDVDLYQSYRVCLEYLYPLVSEGGIIALDEYHANGKWSGCRKAVDEYLQGRESILRSDIMNKYYLIKGG